MEASASERLPALAELRALLPSVVQPLVRRPIADAIASHEVELRKDLVELESLLAESTTDEVRMLLRQQIATIISALGVGPSPSAAPAPFARAGSIDVSDCAAEISADADDEDEGSAAETAEADRRRVRADKKQQTAAATPNAAPNAAPTTAPKVAPTPAPPKKPPMALDTKMDEPPGGLDPDGWPLASDAGLPADAWRSAHAPIRAVPRCPYGSKAARTLMEHRKPVILTGAPIVRSAAGKWDLPFLSSNLADVACTVYASRTRHFRYWDDDKNDAGYTFPEGEHTEKRTMKIDEFAEKLGASAAAPEASGTDAGGVPSGGDGTRYYLQTALVEGVGGAMMDDFRAFDWEGVLSLQRRLGWGELTSNLLLVGQAGNTTPAHYDEQQNLLAQLVGTKRCLLFAPADFGKLYPFPVHHPHDRQSQVDLYAPDAARFPRFAEVRPLEATLQPGEILYIPQYWWHHLENFTDGCVSLNFWFKDTAKPQKVLLPLSPTQHLAMRRNIEKLVATRLGAHAAQAAMPQLAATAPADAALATLREEIVGLLSHVMPLTEVDGWLEELVAGRFGVRPMGEAGKLV